jgi:archaeosine-15-forming tRNA-guanine transglycosylase
MAPKKPRMPQVKKLKDGTYSAKCKEQTLLSATVNGHSAIWPQAKVVVKGDQAEFFQNGKLVWHCNMIYAANNFDISAITE